MSLNIITIVLLLVSFCFPGALNAAPQEKSFEIARLPGADFTASYDIAADPRSGKIVVVWRTTYLPSDHNIYAAKISNAGSKPSISNVKMISSDSLVALTPSVVFQPGIKRFLVTWEDNGTNGATLVQDIGGRLLAANGSQRENRYRSFVSMDIREMLACYLG